MKLPTSNVWLLLVYITSLVYALILMPIYSDPARPMDAVINLTVNLSFGYWAAYLLFFALTFEPALRRKILLAAAAIAFYLALVGTHFEAFMYRINYVFSVFFQLVGHLLDVKIASLLHGVTASEVEKAGLLLHLDVIGPLLGGLFMGWFVGLFMAGAHSLMRRGMTIKLKPTFLKTHFWGGGFSGVFVGLAILYTLLFTGKGNPTLEQTIGFCFSFFMHIPHLLMCAAHKPQLAEEHINGKR